MICPTCQDEGLKSTLRTGGTLRTLVAYSTYYDEDGYFHNHDRNRSTTPASCSNGHHHEIVSYPPCPSHPDHCDHAGSEEWRPKDNPLMW